MNVEIHEKSGGPSRSHRLLAKVATVAGRTLLLSAGVALVIGLILLVAAWQLFTFPYRRAQPQRRSVAQREALLALVAALAAAGAAFRRAG